MSQTFPITDAALAETPLASRLAASVPDLKLQMHCGVRTPASFAPPTSELQAMLQNAGVYDLGSRAFLRATGKDRVRWMNGMISQTVKGLVSGQTAYTLILNPQGRIQGDGEVYCQDESLLLETDRSQSERLLTQLRRFIIMDDVKLEELDAATTAIGIAGPQSAAILQQAGGVTPEEGRFEPARVAGIDVTVTSLYSPLVPRFELHVASDRVWDLWHALISAGAKPCGAIAVEQLRILQGIPQFGVDFTDKHLPQEANLQRALNYTKGCYIGQEIVERIRARATVHRSLRQFELEGTPPLAGPEGKVELTSLDAAAGELTSVAVYDLPGFARCVALGVVRNEAIERASAEPLRYPGGIAVPLDAPPIPRLDKP